MSSVEVPLGVPIMTNGTSLRFWKTVVLNVEVSFKYLYISTGCLKFVFKLFGRKSGTMIQKDLRKLSKNRPYLAGN